MSIWTNERTEIATWLSGYLNMVKTWVDKILDNEHYDVDKNKIIGLIDEWIAWLEETKLKIMKMKDIDPVKFSNARSSLPYGIRKDCSYVGQRRRSISLGDVCMAVEYDRTSV